VEPKLWIVTTSLGVDIPFFAMDCFVREVNSGLSKFYDLQRMRFLAPFRVQHASNTCLFDNSQYLFRIV